MPSPHRPRRSRTTSRLGLVLAGVVAAAGLTFAPPPQTAEAAALPPSILEGGYIISDAEFFDGDALTAAQIQTFLTGKVAKCGSGYTCLPSYKADIAAKAADKYCKAVGAAKGVTAATIIARVSAACGINPKVVLVMLQKEQGLVTSTAPSKSRYDRAMGFNCPDTTGCSTASLGFFTQVYGGARQLQVYTKNPSSFSYRAGQVNTIKWHPDSSCGTSKVYIQNQATANLYIYTPYRANVAAIAAGTATGDSCSSYGNRNFYNYYTSWFAAGAKAAVSSCLAPPAADISAASGAATVKVAGLNARTAPTLVCSTGMTALAKGATVTLTGRYGMWSRVTTAAGATAWVATTYLDAAPAPAPAGSASPCTTPSAASVTAASGTVQVTTSVLNARLAPSTACDTGRVQLSSGQQYVRTGVYGQWWRITVSGKALWAHSDYLAVVSAPATTPAPAPVNACVVPTSGVAAAAGTYIVRSGTAAARKAPSATCGTGASTLAAGVALTRTGVYKDFTRVKAGTATWWVATAQIKAAPVMKTTAALNLRKTPSTAGARIVTLAKGTKVTVIATKGVWRKVIVGSRTGWVHSRYLR